MQLIRAGKPLLYAAIFVFTPLPSSSGEDWPQWRGPRSDGSWFGPPLATDLADRKLETVWQVPLNPGYSGIAVVDRFGFTMDRPATPADSERIVSFNCQTGGTRWTHVYEAPYGKLDYGSGPRCTPTVHGNRVYTLGAVGHVHCLDRETGQVIWRKDLMKEYGAKLAEWGFAASPVIHGDKVIIHVGAENATYIAFDLTDGREIWRSGTDPLGYGTPIIIQHAGSDQLVGWTPNHILGLAPDDGTELWKVPYKVTYGVSIATPIFRENTVLVSGYWEGTKAIRLGERPTDATLIWEENRNLRGLMSQPIYRDGHVYLLDKQHGVTCFRLSDSEKRWTDSNQLTKRDRNPQVNFMQLGESDQVLCLNAEGELILARFTPTGYTELWRRTVIGPTWAHPALAGDHFYARDDKTLTCIRLPTAESPVGAASR